MVNKTTKQRGAKGKKGKIKVLNLNKETVKDIAKKDAHRVKGGYISPAGGRSQVSSIYSGGGDLSALSGAGFIKTY